MFSNPPPPFKIYIKISVYYTIRIEDKNNEVEVGPVNVMFFTLGSVLYSFIFMYSVISSGNFACLEKIFYLTCILDHCSLMAQYVLLHVKQS